MYKHNIVLLCRNDVLCILDGHMEPLCKTIVKHVHPENSFHALPSFKKLTVPNYIPETVFFKNCTNAKSRANCRMLTINSITQVGKPSDHIEVCYEKQLDRVGCHRTYYHYYSDPNKVYTLSKIMPDKRFYIADCLEYPDKTLVCRPHVNERMRSHVFLVYAGKLVRPAQDYVLLQHNFICEQENGYDVNSDSMKVHITCDLNMYVPYKWGIHTKKGIKVYRSVIFRLNKSSVELKYHCKESWCGYVGSGKVNVATRRDTMYRCFYAKGQEICKELNTDYIAHDEPDWISNK